ncbi:DUF1566 domain-containing protein [Candidatus Woesearchaeota archaeon]|nr:DUF1566 domain-containing protein [Candidatus Woesearchaeota archaeon]
MKPVSSLLNCLVGVPGLFCCHFALAADTPRPVAHAGFGLTAIPAARVASPRFNDTGITGCSDTHHYGVPCPLSLYPGQDGDRGRDALTPGQTGFRHTRLDAGGKPVRQASKPVHCVRDEVTGLVWENKTANGLHDVKTRYTRLPEDPNNAQSLVNATNAEALCGYRDWRLPGLLELQGLVNYGIPFPGPVLETASFALSSNEAYWTDSVDGRQPELAYVVLWDDGQTQRHAHANPHPVRLVRGTPLRSRWTVSADGAEVTDRTTGLVWKRCQEGTRWTGTTCQGSPRYYTWYEALQAVVPGDKHWRVPNVKEMSSLIDPSFRGTLAMNTSLFPKTTNDMFWTSSPYTLDTFYGWIVHSFYGYAYFTYLEDTGALRLVRDRFFNLKSRRAE